MLYYMYRFFIYKFHLHFISILFTRLDIIRCKFTAMNEEIVYTLFHLAEEEEKKYFRVLCRILFFSFFTFLFVIRKSQEERHDIEGEMVLVPRYRVQHRIFYSLEAIFNFILLFFFFFSIRWALCYLEYTDAQMLLSI